MKILHLSTFDTQGGAARAAYRLHRALISIGVESNMLVYMKQTDDPTVVDFRPRSKIGRAFYWTRPMLDQLPLRKYKNREKRLFSPAWVPFSGVVKKINELNTDIVHLHWVCGGMLRIEDLKEIKVPIVWSLHDMWPFTGGCHYSGSCRAYEFSCGKCQTLNSQKLADLSKKLFRKKVEIYTRIANVIFVGLSKWMLDCVKRSRLLKDEKAVNLPNPIDTTLFAPIDKEIAKNILGISKDKKTVLFGAEGVVSDARKGHKEIEEAISELTTKNVEFLIFGKSEPKEVSDDSSCTYKYLGYLYDDVSLKILYGSSNVVVVPSLEENLSNIIMESLACGTPVVAFDIGGNSDLIDHKKNGYLARPFDTSDLARGIEWVLQNPDYDSLCENAREKVVRNFGSKVVAAKYKKLYEEILNGA